MKTVILNQSVARPPFFGQRDDVMQLPDDVADDLIKDGSVETVEARKSRKLAEAQANKKPAKADDDVVLVESGEVEEEKRIEENLKGVDELFELQASDLPVAPVEKKKK